MWLEYISGYRIEQFYLVAKPDEEMCHLVFCGCWYTLLSCFSVSSNLNLFGRFKVG